SSWRRRFATWVDRGLLHRSRRRRSESLDVRLESRPIGVAIDDQVESVVLEAVDGALSEERIVESGYPLRGVSVARHHRREARIPLDEELVDVTAFLAAHRLQCEVVDDEHVDR